ncbi:YciI family protein [Plantactinospora solaniradicis]|uniref:YciI family protein n=1 Tax=Plantactinospora solaniradicis TaxID=1723736 RepID=A0ABW1KL06_9ACTN
MKFLILIYCGPGGWMLPGFLRSPEAPAMSRVDRAGPTETLFTELTESGELVAGTALADPLDGRTVRVHDGVPTVEDGPHDATRAQLAGYVVVDCEHRHRAGEIAARFPSARSGAVEVRPIMDMSGQEM